MAFETVKNILTEVDKHHTAAIAFNCNDYMEIKCACLAAEAVKKPIILMLYPGYSHLMDHASFAAVAKVWADKVSVPVGIHLDHCGDFDEILFAIRCGFQSVMIDGSSLPFEENIKITREVVKAAHALGANVEAELGHVGIAANQDNANDDMYTSPASAAEFVDRTEVDSLAVAIGTAHGFYAQTPKLDLHRLEEINAATDCPLVMHGGSGVPHDQLQEAFRKGINKLNVGTEWFHLTKNTLGELCTAKENDYMAVLEKMQPILTDYIEKKMQLCEMTL